MMQIKNEVEIVTTSKANHKPHFHDIPIKKFFQKKIL